MKLGVVLMTIGIVMGASARVWATDVVNQDNKAYTLTIVDGSVKSTKKLAAQGTIYGLCTGRSTRSRFLAQRSRPARTNAS